MGGGAKNPKYDKFSGETPTGELGGQNTPMASGAPIAYTGAFGQPGDQFADPTSGMVGGSNPYIPDSAPRPQEYGPPPGQDMSGQGNLADLIRRMMEGRGRGGYDANDRLGNESSLDYNFGRGQPGGGMDSYMQRNSRGW